MGRYANTLKNLRKIALEHGAQGQPDLALMARELGRAVRQESKLLTRALAPLHARQKGFEHWQIASRKSPALSMSLLCWPPGHQTLIQDHDGRWGMELTLVGALEIQSYAQTLQGGELHPTHRDWLGPGDGKWFEGGGNHAHRLRNLSRYDTALTLHICAGNPGRHFCHSRDAGAISQALVTPGALATPLSA